MGFTIYNDTNKPIIVKFTESMQCNSSSHNTYAYDYDTSYAENSSNSRITVKKKGNSYASIGISSNCDDSDHEDDSNPSYEIIGIKNQHGNCGYESFSWSVSNENSVEITGHSGDYSIDDL